uniref:Uncharacterized protein n=1 Tax=Anopheles coluzzii TaxID=1518534 RepID=A0A8W7PPJ2_ANOCL
MNGEIGEGAGGGGSVSVTAAATTSSNGEDDYVPPDLSVAAGGSPTPLGCPSEWMEGNLFDTTIPSTVDSLRDIFDTAIQSNVDAAPEVPGSNDGDIEPSLFASGSNSLDYAPAPSTPMRVARPNREFSHAVPDIFGDECLYMCDRSERGEGGGGGRGGTVTGTGTDAARSGGGAAGSYYPLRSSNPNVSIAAPAPPSPIMPIPPAAVFPSSSVSSSSRTRVRYDYSKHNHSGFGSMYRQFHPGESGATSSSSSSNSSSTFGTHASHGGRTFVNDTPAPTPTQHPYQVHYRQQQGSSYTPSTGAFGYATNDHADMPPRSTSSEVRRARKRFLDDDAQQQQHHPPALSSNCWNGYSSGSCTRERPTEATVPVPAPRSDSSGCVGVKIEPTTVPEPCTSTGGGATIKTEPPTEVPNGAFGCRTPPTPTRDEPPLQMLDAVKLEPYEVGINGGGGGGGVVDGPTTNGGDGGMPSGSGISAESSRVFGRVQQQPDLLALSSSRPTIKQETATDSNAASGSGGGGDGGGCFCQECSRTPQRPDREERNSPPIKRECCSCSPASTPAPAAAAMAPAPPSVLPPSSSVIQSTESVSLPDTKQGIVKLEPSEELPTHPAPPPQVPSECASESAPAVKQEVAATTTECCNSSGAAAPVDVKPPLPNVEIEPEQAEDAKVTLDNDTLVTMDSGAADDTAGPFNAGPVVSQSFSLVCAPDAPDAGAGSVDNTQTQVASSSVSVGAGGQAADGATPAGESQAPAGNDEQTNPSDSTRRLFGSEALDPHPDLQLDWITDSSSISISDDNDDVIMIERMTEASGNKAPYSNTASGVAGTAAGGASGHGGDGGSSSSGVLRRQRRTRNRHPSSRAEPIDLTNDSDDDDDTDLEVVRSAQHAGGSSGVRPSWVQERSAWLRRLRMERGSTSVMRRYLIHALQYKRSRRELAAPSDLRSSGTDHRSPRPPASSAHKLLNTHFVRTGTPPVSSSSRSRHLNTPPSGAHNPRSSAGGSGRHERRLDGVPSSLASVPDSHSSYSAASAARHGRVQHRRTWGMRHCGCVRCPMLVRSLNDPHYLQPHPNATHHLPTEECVHCQRPRGPDHQLHALQTITPSPILSTSYSPASRAQQQQQQRQMDGTGNVVSGGSTGLAIAPDVVDLVSNEEDIIEQPPYGSGGPTHGTDLPAAGAAGSSSAGSVIDNTSLGTFAGGYGHGRPLNVHYSPNSMWRNSAGGPANHHHHHHHAGSSLVMVRRRDHAPSSFPSRSDSPIDYSGCHPLGSCHDLDAPDDDHHHHHLPSELLAPTPPMY